MMLLECVTKQTPNWTGLLTNTITALHCGRRSNEEGYSQIQYHGYKVDRHIQGLNSGVDRHNYRLNRATQWTVLLTVPS